MMGHFPKLELPYISAMIYILIGIMKIMCFTSHFFQCKGISLTYTPSCLGVCGRAVDTSNFRSGGPGFKPRPSRFFLRQETLLHFVSIDG